MHATTPRRGRTLAALALLLAAAAMRLIDLDTMPPGFQFDEAYNALDAAGILDGERPLFFPANGGREPLAVYVQAGAMTIVGRDRPVLAVRLASAAAGLITIALVVAAIGGLTRRRKLGWLTGALMAATFWHLHFSRYGIRAVWAPLWITLAVWSWWRATDVEAMNGRPGEGTSPRWRPIIVCGLALAAAIYSHPTGRLLPFVLGGHCLWRVLFRPHLRRRSALALAGAGLVAAVACLPLGLYFWQHPGQFGAHAGDVSLAAVAAKDYGGSLPRAFVANLVAVAGMFLFRGDPSRFHNLPGLPVFDYRNPLVIVFFGAGLGMAVDWWRRRNRDPLVLALLWLGVMLAPTLLSDRPPNFSRAIGALPVICLLPAAGAQIFGASAVRWRQAVREGKRTPWSNGDGLKDLWFDTGLRWRHLMAIGAAFAGISALQYFGTFRNDPELYYSYDADKVDAFTWLGAQAKEANVFLTPVWAEHATLDYLNRFGAWMEPSMTARGYLFDREVHDASMPQDHPLRLGPNAFARLDFHETLVFRPDGRDTLLAAPSKAAEREGLDAAVADLARGAVASGSRAAAAGITVTDDQDQPLLATWRLPRATLGDLQPPTDAPLEPAEWSSAVFGDAIGLVGYDLESAAVVPSTNPPAGAPTAPSTLGVRLIWRSLQAISATLTVFVQLEDARGQAAGQLDREPAWASHPTDRWQAGEVVVDAYRVDIRPGAVLPLVARVGWYDARTGRRLTLGDGTDAVELRPR